MGEAANILELLFWACAALVFYSYVAYTVLIWCCSRRAVPQQRPTVAANDLPSMVLLIAAYNEQAMIEQRIQNALALDYPPERMQIVIASDGSTDQTAAIAGRYAERGVRVVDYPHRRGKTTVLNTTVTSLDSQIIMLSDANTFFDRQAALHVAGWFADPSVGVVCGKLVLKDRRTGRNSDGLYWRYETFIKTCEGKLGALLGSNGAIYAIRRDLFPRIPDDTIVDDFVIPLLAKLNTGCRIVYDEQAAAEEEIAPKINDEFRRRARIGAGGYQAIGLLWKLLDPRRGWIAVSFLSHKVLRWLCPFFLIGMFLSALILAHRPLFGVIVVAQAAVMLLSPFVSRLPGGNPAMRLVRLAAMFTLMNTALCVGFFRWLRRSQGGAWTRTLRVAEIPEVQR